MDIERRCSWCGKVFIAHSHGNRYCSERCKSSAKRLRERRKNQTSNPVKDTLPEVEMLGTKPFLSPKEVAILFAVSLPTIYRYMADGVIKALKMTNNRTVIRRADLEKLFEEAPSYKKRKYGRKSDTEYYTMREIVEKYNVSRKGAMNRIKKFRIPKIYDGRNSFFPKKAIEENFAELISDVVLSDFYTIQQIMEKFSMTHAAVLSFVQRHNVSRKTILRKVYYSRDEIDKLKDPLKDEEYYTYPQINQVYGLTKDQIAYYTHAYHLTTGKKGKFTLINKEEFDAIMRNRSKDELRIRFKQKRKQFKEERRKAIKEYIDFVMVPFLDDDRSFDILLENIRHWHLSDDKSFRPVPLSPNHRLTSYDIRHFVWNIGERLGWSGIKRAKFAKYCFPEIMKDLEVETIRRTLKQSPENQFTIKIDIPDSKDDYRFHYSNDK